jgi:hypothetical protein
MVFFMNTSNIIEKEEGSGDLVQLFIYRAPKKNHDAMLQLNKQCTEFFRKHGILRFEVLYLSSTNTVMDFINIAETLSASQDEEVWMEIQSYRDQKHLEEFIANMKNDKIGESLSRVSKSHHSWLSHYYGRIYSSNSLDFVSVMAICDDVEMENPWNMNCNSKTETVSISINV